MYQRRAVIAMVLLLAGFGCAESHDCDPTPSGIPGCTLIADMSDTDIRQYCEWEYSLHEDPGIRTCEPGGAGVGLVDVEGCIWRMDLWRGRDCTRTVAENGACWAAIVDDACATMREVCTATPRCTEASDGGVDAGD